MRRSHKKIGKRGAKKKTKKLKKGKKDKKVKGGGGWQEAVNKHQSGSLMIGGSGWHGGNNQGAETVSTGDP